MGKLIKIHNKTYCAASSFCIGTWSGCSMPTLFNTLTKTSKEQLGLAHYWLKPWLSSDTICSKNKRNAPIAIFWREDCQDSKVFVVRQFPLSMTCTLWKSILRSKAYECSTLFDPFCLIFISYMFGFFLPSFGTSPSLLRCSINYSHCCIFYKLNLFLFLLVVCPSMKRINAVMLVLAC